MPHDQDQWVLRADDVRKHYGSTVALDGVSLALEAGESVAIMGPSGSGKSTLLHVLAGILAPDSGRVLLRSTGDGRPSDGTADGASVDVAALSDDARSALRLRRFGFVFQQGLLLPELTAIENVALPLLLTGVPRVEAEQRGGDGLTRLGIGGLGDRRIGQLSGGQAQRVAIARALVHHPQVVFADEPTGALDSRTADEVLDQLLRLTGVQGRALVVVTHDEHVASRCTRTIRLRDGRLVDGSTA
ncbi:MAG: ABC transporter ATP-binding protein [Microbacterium sp.]